VNLLVALTAFALIFPIELPDKTFIATIVLATRLPGRMVWLGVSTAFGVQCVVAVVAGRLIGYLPKTLVLSITGLAFLIGGLILLRGAKGEAKEEEFEEAEFESRVTKEAKGTLTGYRAALVSFGIVSRRSGERIRLVFSLDLGPPWSPFQGSESSLGND
jgi:hypothetical protein